MEAFVVELDSESGTDATVIDSSAVVTILDPLTYQSPQVPRAIPDAKNAGRPGVVTSSLDVSANGMVYDLNVNLDISHAFVSDLAVTLLAPNGTLVELFSQVGGSGDNFGATRLDDQAGTPINEGNAPFKASYRPEGSLATFEHMDPSGTWTLEITDSQRGNSGTLNSWSLEIATYEPIPNDAPIAFDDTYGVTEDNTLNVLAPGVLGNDLDDDSDALTAEIVGNVAHGACHCWSTVR